ncbi:nickel-dependent hydrogenase large subunit [Chitinophaga sancti]|uniref:nickel-dependent hydrogenase large subunit n=1 Tax=Chitinophaga sancti TaxID=1004 RepID=UPI002A752A70|nr:nickel-dependent hydrogenase large subunit [Chitinophaga sancti]WPQ66001.1 nickel-dependent hydrogenase large subunit [Chitinophaga sancti]
MNKRIVVDPVTRIEGHLRIEAEIENGKIKDAYSSGTMVRLLEEILRNRDPRDAWAIVGRVCGVCTSVHSLTSVRSVEDALNITVPPNAELVRNIMYCTSFMHDHVVHFYHLHAMDWIDVVNALKADPQQTSALAQKISKWPKSSPGYFSDLQKRIKKLVDSGQLGIFSNGYWGHPAYKLPPEVNLIGLAHYLEALEWQKEVVKVQAVFGGKNPHPNYLVGGMACAIGMDDVSGINAERLSLVKRILDEAKTFIEQVYIPDLMTIASYYKEWGSIGGGLGNFMVYGDLPWNGYRDVSSYKFPPGVILNKDLSKLYEVDLRNDGDVQEFITHSWYEYKGGKDIGLHPWKGESKIRYTGPKPPFEHLDMTQAYSYLKTPRWQGHAMEVGPLARVLVGYARGREEFKDVVDRALKTLDIPATALISTLGRTAARGFEASLVSQWALDFYYQLVDNIKKGDTRMANMDMFNPDTWPKKAIGVGHAEAPRGALAHWINIEDKKISNYQLVVPTTWNASPRDSKGQLSAYESALVGTPVADEKQPLEILRTVHSFDPCLACAVHLYDEHGNHINRVSVLEA